VDFSLSEDQSEIKRTARYVLAGTCSWQTVRAAATDGERADLWAEISALGWPGIAIGEAHGGSGLGMIEAAILVEEGGYACLPAPLLPTIAAGVAVHAAGSGIDREQWLPRLASGGATAVFGFHDLVVGATDPDLVVIIDPKSARCAFAHDAVLVRRRSIDPTRAAHRLKGGGPGIEGNGAASVRTLIAAELVGLAQRALDMSVEYARQREQFGAPIGSFQAVAHRCVDMYRAVECARTAVYYAAWAIAHDQDAENASALAAACAGSAGTTVTGSAIQVHGGVGFTLEADLHWLFRRAQVDAVLLGSSAHHYAELARNAAAREAAPREGLLA
jgi:alkylation response protein AidB-like acyl-CoA dehydrogenase